MTEQQQISKKDLDDIWRRIHKAPTEQEKKNIINSLNENVINALRKTENPYKIPIIATGKNENRILKCNIINVREKYMKRFIMTSLIGYTRRMLDEFMPDKCESMISENSTEFAKIMNAKVKHLQVEGPREKYTESIKSLNARIRELSGASDADKKEELSKITKQVYEDNVRLLKYNIFCEQQNYDALELSVAEIQGKLNSSIAAKANESKYLEDLKKITAIREKVENDIATAGQDAGPRIASEAGLNDQQFRRPYASYVNEVSAKTAVIERLSNQIESLTTELAETTTKFNTSRDALTKMREDIKTVEKAAKKIFRNFSAFNVEFEKYTISDEEYEKFVEEVKQELGITQTAEEYADEYRKMVSEFFEHHFKYNPDIHVSCAYRPNYSDPTRKPLTQDEINGVRTETEREHAVSLIPPNDTFYRWERYTTEHYEELRQATDDIYCEKSDLEFTIAPLAVFSGADAEEQSKRFDRKYAEEFEADVITAKFGQHTMLAAFEQNRERREIYTEKTEIIKRIIEQNEADAKIGMNMTKKRAKTERAKTEKKTGAYATAGLQQYAAGATRQLRKHGVSDIKEITASDIPEDRENASMKEVEVGVTVIKPVKRKGKSSRITGVTDQWHFNIPAKAPDAGTMAIKMPGEVKSELTKEEMREELGIHD